MNPLDGQGTPGGVKGEPALAQQPPTLAKADAAALDALIEAGWDQSRIADEHKPRAARAAHFLSRLEGAPIEAADPALIDAVLVRVAKLRQRAGRAADELGVKLHPDDASATDALVAAAFDAEKVPEPLKQRARRQQQLLAALDVAPASAHADDLVARTLAFVDQASQKEESRLSITQETSRLRGRRFQFNDLIAVAAILLIGAAVVWPMLTGAIEYNRRVSCQTNMQAAGLGFGQYARDNRDVLPMASASPAGNPWWEVGHGADRSNSANLYTLSRAQYVKVGDLSCAGNPGACRADPRPGAVDWDRICQVSFSYRIMFGCKSNTLTPAAGGVLMSDRSPMVIVGSNQLTIFPFRNSDNHLTVNSAGQTVGAGQNVLLGDGSVQWMTSPVRPNGDNLWLPRPFESLLSQMAPPTEAERIKGTETPENDEDAFVGPGSVNASQNMR